MVSRSTGSMNATRALPGMRREKPSTDRSCEGVMSLSSLSAGVHSYFSSSSKRSGPEVVSFASFNSFSSLGSASSARRRKRGRVEVGLKGQEEGIPEEIVLVLLLALLTQEGCSLMPRVSQAPPFASEPTGASTLARVLLRTLKLLLRLTVFFGSWTLRSVPTSSVSLAAGKVIGLTKSTP